MRLRYPAAERNAAPIADALGDLVQPGDRVLEIGSGSGQHAVAFAARFPEILWQPCDPDPECRESIRAWIEHEDSTNVLPPIDLDVTAGPFPAPADGSRWNAIYCANVLHVSPWTTTLALLHGAAPALAADGLLILYGPFLRTPETLCDLGPEAGATEAALDAPSNREFDRSLRARDPSWGVRDLGEVTSAAAAAGLELRRIFPLPANNLLVVFAAAFAARGPGL
ncbi:MAG TPA: DUF938 domain-containing protein [Thermoanaerobaculia bacterium]|nr:DUF938 domain-containing protein [Thermoanaerobaculia bacterium]